MKEIKQVTQCKFNSNKFNKNFHSRIRKIIMYTYSQNKKLMNYLLCRI